MEIEKKRRSTEDRTEFFSSIPLDLTVEILLRLPVKSIGRFRCVSKLWSAVTTTPHFVKSFAVHSSARPCILSVKKEEDKRVFFSLPHHHDDPQNRCTRVQKYDMMLPKEDTCLAPTDTNFNMSSFEIRQSINGLISFGNSESVIIWNPTLRQHVTLPEPKISKPLISFLGYDPIGDEYKVLCMSLKKGEDPQIFTMGAQESWRTIQSSPSPIHHAMKSWRCIKGVVYYFTADETIASFDVRSEKFQVIQIPEIGYILFCRSGLISHRGRLAWFNNNHGCDGDRNVTLWVLEDSEKHQWSQEDRFLPFRIIDMNPWNGFLQSTGETADDELIYLPTSTDGPFYVIYYDFKRDSVRKVTYDGIEDNKFRFNCFPNHVDSLVSFKNLLHGGP